MRAQEDTSERVWMSPGTFHSAGLGEFQADLVSNPRCALVSSWASYVAYAFISHLPGGRDALLALREDETEAIRGECSAQVQSPNSCLGWLYTLKWKRQKETHC